MEWNNYEIAREQAKKIFLGYDQETLIQKWDLEYDTNYLYVEFVNRVYRIDRENGTVWWSENDFVTEKEADFNVTLTIFDLLCYSKVGCYASGQFDAVNNLKGTGHTGNPAGDMFAAHSTRFDQKSECLSKACEMLNGIAYPVGDVAYIIPIFGDLKMLFQFWASDDEFGAQMKMKWDKNVLDYMHFETVHYAMGHILQRLSELI